MGYVYLFTNGNSFLKGGAMEETEMAFVIDEIRYVDPGFEEQEFILHCERVVFPSLVEAWLSGDKEVLQVRKLT